MNIQKMMQQAQVMQDKMQDMQTKLDDMEVEGVAGGGLVKVVATCKGSVRSISLDDSIIDKSEKEVLEDLIKAALNDVKVKADQMIADETQKIMDDLGLPAGVKLPF